MITKKVRTKGKVVLKRSAKGDDLYYVEVLYQGEKRILLMKGAKDVIANLRISPDYLPHVYGTIICYTDQEGITHNTKFRIKGIDKHQKNRNSYGPSTKY